MLTYMTEKNPPESPAIADSEAPSEVLAAPSGPVRALTPAARRALAEAQARRAEIDRKAQERPVELHGRKNGPEPARYGDWEVKGIASDF
jgi:hypothetical protein